MLEGGDVFDTERAPPPLPTAKEKKGKKMLSVIPPGQTERDSQKQKASQYDCQRTTVTVHLREQEENEIALIV